MRAYKAGPLRARGHSDDSLGYDRARPVRPAAAARSLSTRALAFWLYRSKMEELPADDDLLSCMLVE